MNRKEARRVPKQAIVRLQAVQEQESSKQLRSERKDWIEQIRIRHVMRDSALHQ